MAATTAALPFPAGRAATAETFPTSGPTPATSILPSAPTVTIDSESLPPAARAEAATNEPGHRAAIAEPTRVSVQPAPARPRRPSLATAQGGASPTRR